MKIPGILFLGQSNSVRTILAEAYLHQKCAGMFRVFSAGLEPADELDNSVTRVLQEQNMSTEALEPKSVELFLQPHAPEIDTIICFSRQLISALPASFMGGQQCVHWHIPAPVCEGADLKSVLRDTFADIRLRVDRLLAGGMLNIENVSSSA
ncbi:MAG: hypothetical protein JKY49_04900 [Cohaesibacteraceae bacterium]|nr:hypothetical protein [Cohaesibacteraceae bacterium]MBL4875106.1 hypothetical protein [Cohaesibacteraceae bacterium]